MGASAVVGDGRCASKVVCASRVACAVAVRVAGTIGPAEDAAEKVGATAGVIAGAGWIDRVTVAAGAGKSLAAQALNIDRLIKQTARASRFMKKKRPGV